MKVYQRVCRAVRPIVVCVSIGVCVYLGAGALVYHICQSYIFPPFCW